MKLSRLDTVIKNNVDFSTQKSLENQKLYILQDISTTLAMIYDKMCENDKEKDENE